MNYNVLFSHNFLLITYLINTFLDFIKADEYNF